MAGEVSRARLAQDRESGRGTVVRVTVAKRLRRRLDDMRRRREVGFAGSMRMVCAAVVRCFSRTNMNS